MKQFHIVGTKATQTMTEAHLVRSGYILSGAVGLVESIESFKSHSFDVVVDDLTAEPYILTESSALTEGYFDIIKEKLSGALKKLKDGEISKDAFDKYYDELKTEGKMSYGKGTFTDRVGGDGAQVNPAAGFGARGSAGVTSTSSAPRKVFADKPAEDKAEPTIDKEELAKKIGNYKKMFRLDLSKYKKLFEMDPAAVDEFKAMIDQLTSARDTQFAALSEAEEPKEDVEAKVADAVKEQEVKEEPKPETTEPKAEPVAETPVAEKSGRFGVKFKDSMVVFDGKPEVGSKVKVIKVADGLL